MKGKPCPAPGFAKGYTPWNKGTGKPSDVRAYRKSLQYRLWRRAVLERDYFTCTGCGRTGGDLDADHVKPISKFPDLAFSVENGRTLCKPCHKLTPTYGAKARPVKIVGKNVAVLGGLGFIGTTLHRELVERGNNVLVIDNLLVGKMKNLHPDARFEWYDIRDSWQGLARILRRYDIEHVFNYVALPYIPDCYTKPEQFFETDASGVLHVILACEDAGVKRLLQVSSAEIYGTKSGMISEEEFVQPHSTYGAAKAAADYLCQIRVRETGMHIVVNRQFNVYGEHESHSYVIPEIIEQLARGSSVTLGNIKAERDFLYVKDAACMAIELLEKGTPGEVYNVGAEKCISIEDLAYQIGRLMGHKKVRIQIDPSRFRPWDIERLQADVSKLKRTIEYRQKFRFEDGLKRTIEFFRRNKGWDF